MLDLKAIRIERGMTMKQVAEKAGISESYISVIESGKQSMPVHTAGVVQILFRHHRYIIIRSALCINAFSR